MHIKECCYYCVWLWFTVLETIENVGNVVTISLGDWHRGQAEISQSWPALPRPRGSRPSNLTRDHWETQVRTRSCNPATSPCTLEPRADGSLEAGWSRDPPVTVWEGHPADHTALGKNERLGWPVEPRRKCGTYCRKWGRDWGVSGENEWIPRSNADMGWVTCSSGMRGNGGSLSLLVQDRHLGSASIQTAFLHPCPRAQRIYYLALHGLALPDWARLCGSLAWCLFHMKGSKYPVY